MYSIRVLPFQRRGADFASVSDKTRKRDAALIMSGFRNTVFSSPDQFNHSATVPVPRQDSSKVDASRLQSGYMSPRHLRPICNIDPNYGHRHNQYASEYTELNGSESQANTRTFEEGFAGSLRECSQDHLFSSAEDEGILRRRNAMLMLLEPDEFDITVHDAFESAATYLTQITNSLRTRIRDIQEKGNAREVESKYDGRITVRDRERLSSNARGCTTTPMPEQAECQLLTKHALGLTHKWRRETSLSSEALARAMSLLNAEIAIGEKLHSDLKEFQVF